MFEQIVVGVDEYEAARDAIALAKQLAGPSAAITLVFVAAADRRVYARSAVDEAQERKHALERLGELARIGEVRADMQYVVASSIGGGLHNSAHETGADLMVVGSSRRGLMRRVLIGDETSAALNGAPCAVAIAPVGHAHEPDVIREIGVGYDESPESEYALQIARGMARDLDARLSAMEVVSLPRYLLRDGAAPADVSIEEFVADARARIEARGGVEAHAVYGHVAEELAIYSASVDLLVIGSRGYGPIGRLVHGSASHQLARTSRCPLLMLTRAAGSQGLPTAAREQQVGRVAVPDR